ncbi:MAG: hypothetical protein ACHQD8_05550 [Chitinophagales bacterium]
MKNAVLTLLLISLSLCTNAQFKNDLRRLKLMGRVKSVTEYEYNAAHDSLRWKSVTKFNDTGNVVGFFTYSPTGTLLSKTTFKYNDSGKIIEENRYKADGSFNVRTTYQFDIKGNKTEEDNYDAGGTLFMKVLSKFDGKGNRIVKDSYNEFGALFLKCNSKFDDEGHETEAKEYDSHHGLKFTTTYDYEKTDNAGNWLKRTTYKNDDSFEVTDREIAYY